MYIMLGLLSISLITLIILGIYFELKPSSAKVPHWLKSTIGFNLLTFMIGILGLLFAGIQEVMAATEIASVHDVSIGKGLALIGIALPTCFSTLAAGIAVAPIGAASLAAIAEKPENFGRSLIYLGLAEGIAIYGLVVSILLMPKI